ncbi:Protein RRP5 like, partial [Glycine soja]
LLSTILLPYWNNLCYFLLCVFQLFKPVCFYKSEKKAKEEREKQIRAAEERLLEDDVPRTADEFEKLIRSSPNSSFTWIKYMDFMVSMAAVEKARSIAERYI